MSRTCFRRRKSCARTRRLFLEQVETRWLLATFVVNATSDEADANLGDGICEVVAQGGVCTLRAAIAESNAFDDGGPDTITFAISANDPQHLFYADDGVAGQVSLANVTVTTAAVDSALSNPDPDWAHSWFSIVPQTALPNITAAVVIDGYTQPSASSNTNDVSLGLNSVLRIEVNGDGLDANGLNINAANSSVQGLVINRFGGNNGSGILLTTAGNIVGGNYLGTDVSGTVDVGNQQGVRILANTNTIGGLTAAARNLVSGNNGAGVSLSQGTASKVQGNLIGTNRAGTVALGNLTGVQSNSNDHTIGGTQVGAQNLISGNSFAGIEISQGNNNLVQGN